MKASPASAALRWLAIALLAIGHGLGDFNAGVVLASLDARVGGDLVVLFVLYNALAFAAQPFAGWIADRFGSPLAWFLAGGAVSAVSLLLAELSPWSAVALAGAASALYHSGGGAAAWKLGRESALAAGLFSAPGVLGLALGMMTGARFSFFAALLTATLLALVLGAVAWLGRAEIRGQNPRPAAAGNARVPLGGVAGWCVLFAIAARSLAWSLGQEAIFPAQAAVGIAIAAAVGKSAAGFFADRWGCEAVTLGALTLAIALLAASQRWSAALFPAAAMLQAGTGPMLALALRAWPARPAFASGLAQGLAVAIGGAPLFMLRDRPQAPWLVAIGLLVLAMALVWRTRGGKKPRAESPESRAGNTASASTPALDSRP